MSDLTDKAKGQYNETAGKLQDDKSQEAKGRAQQAKGDLENTADNAKQQVKETVGDNS